MLNKKSNRFLLAGVLIALAVFVIWACGGGGGGGGDASTGSLTITGSPTAVTLSGMGRSAATSLINGTPSSVKIKAYKIYLAENADCSNPVLVADNSATADYVDLMSRPTLFSASSVAPGTYNCMIVKMSDILKFTPDAVAEEASSGVCTAGQEYTYDIVKVETPPESLYDIETGETIPGAGTFGVPVEQTVFLFGTTDCTTMDEKGTCSTPNSVTTANPSVHYHQMFKSANPIVITAGQSTEAELVFDFTDRGSVVDADSTYYCWLEGPTMQFIAQ